MTDGRLRVLHVLTWLSPTGGGIQTYLRAVFKALESSGIELLAGALKGGQPTREVPQPAYLGRPGASAAGQAVSFARWLLRAAGTADLVHIHGVIGWAFVLGAVMCRWMRIPYVVTPHGQVTHWMFSVRPIRRRMYLHRFAAPLLRRAACVVATTDAEAREIGELVPGAPVAVLTPGLEFPDQWRRKGLRTAGGPLQLLFIGGFSMQKGLPVLLRGLAALRDRGIPARLVLAGSGTSEVERDLHQLAEALRLEAAVEFPGYLTGPAKERALLDCDVFVLPSYMENFSFATAEALAYGVPVVISSAVALSDLVRAEGCGSVVGVDDPVGLATALAEYVDESRLADRSRCARACAERYFRLDSMGRQLAWLYRNHGKDR